MRHIIAILLQNEAGALSRVAGLFSTRGYNIESLSVAPTDDATVSRITMVTTGEHLERELVLLKLKVRPEHTDGLRGYVVRTGGRVLDPALDGFIVELTASESEINSFIRDLASRADLLEVARSGALGMGRTARPMQLVKSSG